MNILNINDKNFINCRSITDYKDKITSIYKDKCFLFLKELDLNDFRYNSKILESIKGFALIKINDITYENTWYTYYPESLVCASNSNITFCNIVKTISLKYGFRAPFIDSCYLELTKELVYELE